MHAFVDWAVAVSSQHSTLAYLLVLVLAAGEALPVFGALIPGTTVIIAMATLIAAGALRYWPFASAVAVGAVLGDGISYALGHRYKRAVLERWPLSRHPELARRGEALFARHGGKSVIVSRFTPAVRAIIPMLAGILEMPPARFFAADVPAAIVWALSHVLFGVLVGASLELLGAVAGRLAILAGLLILLAWGVIWFARWLARRLPVLIARIAEPLALWAERPSWLAGRLRAALSANRAEALSHAVIAALLAGGLWLLLGALQDLIADNPLVRLDGVVLQALSTLRSHWGDHAMRLVAATAAPWALIALAALGALALAFCRQWPLFAAWLLGLAGAFALGWLLIFLPNAVPPRIGLISPWFPPSASALVAATLFGLLALVALRAVTPRFQPAIASAALLVIVFGAAARLYLGLTLLSTEVIAIAFALFWIGLAAALAQLRRLPVRRGWVASLLVVPVLAAAVAAEATGATALPLPPMPARPPPYVMSLSAWQDGGWDMLPGTRVGLLGNYTRPFTLQWAGTPEDLARTLEQRGWRRPPPWSLSSTAEWLTPGVDPLGLPVLPHFADGLPQALVLVHETPTAAGPARLVLRLWPSNAALHAEPKPLPIWLGAITEEHFRRIAATVTISRTSPAPSFDLARLAMALPAARLVVDREVAPRARHSATHAPVLLGWEPGAGAEQSP
ncbi:MAG: VTT domain-containing protein [Acetobacteraceae bacterium]